MAHRRPDQLRADAERIFRAALARVDPIPMMRRVLRLERDRLLVETESARLAYHLAAFDRVLVAGAGKASARMAAGLEAILGERISGGLVVTKRGHLEALGRVRLLEAGHPVPDEASVRGAAALLELAAGCDERTLVVDLLSGGGSALLCAPACGADGRPLLTLEEKRAVTGALLACGATIHELNAVRKHLSQVKGGRLARSFGRATVLDLILSDVVGDDLDVIASGPTVADRSTFADALAVVRRYRLAARLPAAALRVLEAGAAGGLLETVKPGDPALARVTSVLVGTNGQAVQAAAAEATRLGYRTVVRRAPLAGEARAMALALLAEAERDAAGAAPGGPPCCLLAGGETTVTLRGAGKGGRNQELALAALQAMARRPPAREVVLLAASTDGNDGPTGAAGAFASRAVAERARALGLDPAPFLAANDSYHFHERAGSLLETGPTNTNVSDLAVVLVA